MTFPARLVVASKNAHKLREIARICADWPVELVTFADADALWPDVEEPFDTYLDNALVKAREIAAAFDLPAIADDSGIEVDALGGAPGPRSARFAGEDASDEENLAKLLSELREVPPAARTARYRCVAAVAWPGGETVSSEGTCEGTIVEDRRGVGGFGYDPAFLPLGKTRTMAELSDEEKDEISHRGRAFRAVRRRLTEG